MKKAYVYICWWWVMFLTVSACKPVAVEKGAGTTHETSAAKMPAGPPGRAQRLALIIGNENYKRLPHLTACRHDAEEMAAIFQKIGVTVFGGKPLLDLTANEMDAALKAFAQSLGPGSEAYFYYSGHGAQIEKVNYLLPVNFDAQYATQARRESIAVDDILLALEDTTSQLHIVILDACRSPGDFLPGEPSQKGVASAGLAEPRVDVPETLVCFATKHGTAALADDKASFYSRILAEEMLKPGKIEDVMKVVMRRVMQVSEGRQIPFIYGNLIHDHFFVADSEEARLAQRRAKMDEEVQRRVKEQIERMAQTPTPAPPSQLVKLSTPAPVVAPATPALSTTRSGGSPRSATKEKPLVNSLGMEFIPTPGKNVLMCRTDVRVKDFRKYVEESGYQQSGGALELTVKKNPTGRFAVSSQMNYSATWENPGFKQGDDHPVVCVSWDEAQSFCAWLSTKEERTYRLPRDSEWSAAAGDSKYPWGDYFPPKGKDGNFGDRSYMDLLGSLSGGSKWNSPLDRNDGFARTAPVGSYHANRNGFYDMGGNVWQWCEDEYRASMNNPDVLIANPTLKEEKSQSGMPYRVLRGGCWVSLSEMTMRSSYRSGDFPSLRDGTFGFRCVLVISDD